MIVVVDYLRADKHSGVLMYRRKFPKDLAAFIPGGSPSGRSRVEFKVSLRCRSMNAPGASARLQAAQDAYAAVVKSGELRRASALKRSSGTFDVLDEPAIASLAARYRVEALASDQDRRNDPDAKARAAQMTDIARNVGFTLPSVPESAKWTQSVRLLNSTIREAVREMRANGDIEGIVGSWGELAMSMASDCGFEIENGGISHQALCVAINDQAATAHEEALRRLDGDLVATPPMPAAPSPREASRRLRASISLLDLFDRYAAVPDRHPKTIAQWRPYIAHLAKFVGGKATDEVTHDDLVAWRNHLRDQETYRSKPLSAKTINGSYLGAVNAMFAWAKGDGVIARNPALEVTKVKLPAQPVTRSKQFTKDEVETILTASFAVDLLQKTNRERCAKRWVPWLMAYSGARVNEMTQLRKEDIFEREGFWVMRITPDAGTVKNKAYRLVPLHSHLIDQGFLQFVRQCSDGPLFYDPEKRRSDNAINRQANSLGSKVAAWVRSLGIGADVKPNHAWRHFFSTHAVRHGMDHSISDAITGHAGSTVKENTYLAGLRDEVDLLAREMEKLPRYLEVARAPADRL